MKNYVNYFLANTNIKLLHYNKLNKQWYLLLVILTAKKIYIQQINYFFFLVLAHIKAMFNFNN